MLSVFIYVGPAAAMPFDLFWCLSHGSSDLCNKWRWHLSPQPIQSLPQSLMTWQETNRVIVSFVYKYQSTHQKSLFTVKNYLWVCVSSVCICGRLWANIYSNQKQGLRLVSRWMITSLWGCASYFDGSFIVAPGFFCSFTEPLLTVMVFFDVCHYFCVRKCGKRLI